MFYHNSMSSFVVSMVLLFSVCAQAEMERIYEDQYIAVNIRFPLTVSEDISGNEVELPPGYAVKYLKSHGDPNEDKAGAEVTYSIAVYDENNNLLPGEYSISRQSLDEYNEDFMNAMLRRGGTIEKINSKPSLDKNCMSAPEDKKPDTKKSQAKKPEVAKPVEDADFIKSKMSDEVDVKNPLCQNPGGCDATPLSKNDPLRDKFDKFVIQAANIHGINPALLKAQLHAETTMNPLLENAGEKKAIAAGKGDRNYKWGKGLGQFGANNAGDYDLIWSAPKPVATEKELLDPKSKINKELLDPNSAINKPNAKGQFSIWSPLGGILAKARMLKERLDKEYTVDVVKEGVKKTIRVDTLYKRNEVEKTRYLAGMYNRGVMPINSVREYYRQNKKFPRYYGEAWATNRKRDTPKASILKGEDVNRCHVYKIAGLCGEEAQGYLKEYSQDFKKNAKGEWESV